MSWDNGSIRQDWVESRIGKEQIKERDRILISMLKARGDTCLGYEMETGP